MLLAGKVGMSAAAPTEDFDPERTRLEEESGTMRSSRSETSTGQVGRGSVLAGKYRLELLLGEGGMGHVWSAYNLELQLPVAIKLLRAGHKNAGLAERLRFEARAAARLVHPNIVRVFDMAIADNGDPFIVMELLTGESLAEVLSRGRLSGVRAVQLMLPIAEGLALAHARGIIHRDLKPDNVFLSTDNEQLQPKLLDFGIAKLVHASALTEKLTGKGMLLGSPNYMSPEQARGDEVDYRTDIWSFCVVLFKAIMGASPFSRADRRAMIEAIINDEPTSLTFDASVDKQLAQLIAWGLSKEPAQRPTSIRELGRQLAQWLLNQGVSDDASGAPLAAKWIAHVAEPSMRRPPPLEATFEAPPAEPVDIAYSRSQSDPHAARTALSPQRKLERVFPARHRPWALLAVVSMSLVGAAAAWTAAPPDRDAPSAMVDPIAEPPRAPPYLGISPAPRVLSDAGPPAHEALVLPAEPQAPTEPAPRIAKPKSARSMNRPAPASRLPFP